jgi:predicted transcriptional regulator
MEGKDEKLAYVLASPVSTALLVSINRGEKNPDELNAEFKEGEGLLNYYLNGLLSKELISIDNSGVYRITKDGKTTAERVISAVKASEEIII